MEICPPPLSWDTRNVESIVIRSLDGLDKIEQGLALSISP